MIFVVSFRFIQKQQLCGRSFRNDQIRTNRAIRHPIVKLHGIYLLDGQTAWQIPEFAIFCWQVFGLESAISNAMPLNDE
jgi:hypothetical protein